MPTTTRRGAAAKQHLADATEPDILDLVLCTRPSLEQGVVCALLCASRGTAARVGQVCSGSLALRAAPTSLQAARQLSDWLVSNAGLLRHLEFAPDMPLATPMSVKKWGEPAPAPPAPLTFQAGPAFQWQPGQKSKQSSLESFMRARHASVAGEPAAADNAAAGLLLARGLAFAAQRDAASLSGLTSFSCHAWDAAQQSVLLNLPSTLTRLQLSWENGTDTWYDARLEPEFNVGLNIASGHFSGLHSLELTVLCKYPQARSVLDETMLLVPALQPLTQLTELKLHGLCFGDDEDGAMEDMTRELQDLPSVATLQRLDIRLNSYDMFPVDLAFLTALTHLTIDHSFRNNRYPSKCERDRLPPNLVSLRCHRFTAKVLSECPSLRRVNDHTELELAELLRVSKPTEELK